jgi:hypothetical protein
MRSLIRLAFHFFQGHLSSFFYPITQSITQASRGKKELVEKKIQNISFSHMKK